MKVNAIFFFFHQYEKNTDRSLSFIFETPLILPLAATQGKGDGDVKTTCETVVH